MAAVASRASSSNKDEKELERRARRKDSYHLVATRKRLPSVEDLDDLEEDYMFRYLLSPQNDPLHTSQSKLHTSQSKRAVYDAKSLLLTSLASSGGGDDVNCPEAEEAISQLKALFETQAASSSLPDDDGQRPFDVRDPPPKPTSRAPRRYYVQGPEIPPRQVEGMWIEISKSKYPECLGQNQSNDFLYTLGRMSFNMIAPNDLVCSIQGSFNPVHAVRHRSQLPSCLLKEMAHQYPKDSSGGGTAQALVRSYDIVTAFTIEPGHPVLHPFAPNAKIRRPIEGIMTTYGYVVPTGHNSMDIWFVGGTLEVVRPGDIRDWRHIFNGNAAGKTTRHRRRHQQQPGGHPNNKGDTDMDALDGRIHYSLERPVNAGAHIDILYLDETLRIVRSNQGILSVFARVPYFPDE